MPDLDNGYARHPEFFSCQNPPMADDHPGRVVNHHRHNEPELADTVRDLINLALGMLSRVTWIQSEITHRAILDLNLNQAGICLANVASIRRRFCFCAG